MKTYINHKSAVPWWAAFGAPLLGVPLLVGLLALSNPAETTPASLDETEVSQPLDREIPAVPAKLQVEDEGLAVHIDARC